MDETSTPSTKPQRLRKSILTLAFGQSAAMVISVALSPILTRTFHPEAFGTFNVLLAFASVASVVGSLQYHRAIPKEQQIQNQSAIFILSILCTTASTAILGALFFFAAPLSLGHEDRLLSTALFSSLFVVTALTAIINISLNTIGLNGTVAARIFIQKAGAVCFQISIGLLTGWRTATALVVGYLIAGIASSGLGLSSSLKHYFSGENRRPGLTEIRAAAIHHRLFPISMMPSELLQAAGLNLPTLLLGFFYPLSVVGLYSLAFRIIKLPATIFMTSAAQVYFITCAKQVAAGQSPKNAAQTTAQLIASLTAFPLLCIAFTGPQVFSAVFGDTWESAGHFAQAMAPWILLTTIYGHLPAIFAAKGRLQEQFKLNLIALTTRMLTLTISSLLLPAANSIAVYSLVNILVTTYVYYRAASLTDLPLSRSAIAILPILSISAFFAAIALSFSLLSQWQPACLLSIAVLALPNYFALRSYIAPTFFTRLGAR